MFITSLPAIFAFTDFFSRLEFGAFILIVFLAIYYRVPALNRHWQDPKDKNLYHVLKACWLGEASLWRAFWPFFILANITFIYIDYRADNLTYTIESWRTVHSMLFFPLIWWLTSIWKCSDKTGKKIWAVCARSLAFYFVTDFCLRLYISYNYPQILFDCYLLSLEYGDC